MCWGKNGWGMYLSFGDEWKRRYTFYVLEMREERRRGTRVSIFGRKGGKRSTYNNHFWRGG